MYQYFKTVYSLSLQCIHMVLIIEQTRTAWPNNLRLECLDFWRWTNFLLFRNVDRTILGASNLRFELFGAPFKLVVKGKNTQAIPVLTYSFVYATFQTEKKRGALKNQKQIKLDRWSIIPNEYIWDYLLFFSFRCTLSVIHSPPYILLPCARLKKEGSDAFGVVFRSCCYTIRFYAYDRS